jgi:DNA-binding beta-propeller fold protein YncE
MTRLIITADKHNIDPRSYAFFIFDLELNKVIAKANYTEMLSTDLPDNAGRKSFRPFGIAQSENHIFISSNGNIVKFNNKTLEPIELVCSTGVINTHQIAYYQGCLYRTNTSNDTISKINLNSLEETHFSFKNMSIIDKIDKPRNYSDNDNNHINSLLIHEDKIYVMAHNNNVRDSEVFRLSLDFKEIHYVAKLGRCHHEIIIHNGLLYSLDTTNGALIILNLSSGNQDKYILAEEKNGKPYMFLRGMALFDDKLEIIGSLDFISNNIEINGNATRITFDINNYSITKTPVNDLAIVSCVQAFIEQDPEL